MSNKKYEYYSLVIAIENQYEGLRYKIGDIVECCNADTFLKYIDFKTGQMANIHLLPIAKLESSEIMETKMKYIQGKVKSIIAAVDIVKSEAVFDEEALKIVEEQE